MNEGIHTSKAIEAETISLELITPPFGQGRRLGWMTRGLGTFETSSHNSIYYTCRGMITPFCSCRGLSELMANPLSSFPRVLYGIYNASNSAPAHVHACCRARRVVTSLGDPLTASWS